VGGDIRAANLKKEHTRPKQADKALAKEDVLPRRGYQCGGEDPAAIVPVFLNAPRSVAALGLVFILALIVRSFIMRNFIEAVVREALADNDEAPVRSWSLPGRLECLQGAGGARRSSSGAGWGARGSRAMRGGTKSLPARRGAPIIQTDGAGWLTGANDETLPNLNSQATARPSAENILHYFRGALTHSQLEGLNTSVLCVLELLGLTRAIFLPGPWKLGGARWREARR